MNWDFAMFAPNGLKYLWTIDPRQVDMAQGDPVDYMLEQLRRPLTELYQRRNEKNPNMEEAK